MSALGAIGIVTGFIGAIWKAEAIDAQEQAALDAVNYDIAAKQLQINEQNERLGFNLRQIERQRTQAAGQLQVSNSGRGFGTTLKDLYAVNYQHQLEKLKVRRETEFANLNTSLEIEARKRAIPEIRRSASMARLGLILGTGEQVMSLADTNSGQTEKVSGGRKTAQAPKRTT